VELTAEVLHLLARLGLSRYAHNVARTGAKTVPDLAVYTEVSDLVENGVPLQNSHQILQAAAEWVRRKRIARSVFEADERSLRACRARLCSRTGHRVPCRRAMMAHVVSKAHRRLGSSKVRQAARDPLSSLPAFTVPLSGPCAH
jgi:hypothetical protein